MSASRRRARTFKAGLLYFAYDETGHLIGEYDAKAKPIQEIIYLDQMPIAVARNNALYYVHADHLGTPRAITDTREKVVWRWDSDPFGTTVPDSDGTRFVFNLRFPGQYYDKETNLHYNYFRDYNPATGRYVESDPIGLRGGINTYGYVGASPVYRKDPYGLKIVVNGNRADYDAAVAYLQRDPSKNSLLFFGISQPGMYAAKRSITAKSSSGGNG